ncbi:hypothetical protein Scep_003494 [Stephania cephalantha]|uniref:Glycosyl-hydrolase family 116 N-terminal domain-containing protein n=1 Tax=Stephania cephalantha TaxID=152367 RepID=A0AAP0KRJ1_9MAGN
MRRHLQREDRLESGGRLVRERAARVRRRWRERERQREGWREAGERAVESEVGERGGIEPWTFVQQLGEAVFILLGCPHQVRNLKKPDDHGISSWGWNLSGQHSTYHALFPRAWTIYDVGDWFFDRVGISAIDCPYPCDNTCHNLVFK